jgi:hypothetical protein
MRIATVTATRRPWMWRHMTLCLATQMRRADLSVILLHDVTPGPSAELVGDLPMLIEAVPAAWRLGKILNAGLAEAFRLGADIACVWDDDDDYSIDYLETVERTAREHPDAWLIGKHAFWTEWPDQPERKPVEFVAPSHADGRARWLAGPTIAVTRRAWDAGARYRDEAPIPDGPFLQDAATLAPHVDGWPPFYSTGSGGFALRRFGADHGHAWADPR